MQRFEVKVKYHEVGTDGKDRVCTPTVLLNAESFGDAETQVTTEFDGFEDFEVKAIKKSTISEVVVEDGEEGDKFFLCVPEFYSLDENSGKEKKVKSEILVAAADNDIASKRLRAHLTDTMSDYEITKVAFSPISQIINLN